MATQITKLWCSRHACQYSLDNGCQKCAVEAIKQLDTALDAIGARGLMRSFAHEIHQSAGLAHALATVEAWRPRP